MRYRVTRLRAVIAFALLGSAVTALSIGSIVRATTDQAPPQELTETASAFEGNVALAPPRDDATPKVSSADAVAAAVDSLAAEDVKAEQATLASFSWSAVPVDENDKPTGPPIYDDVLVWAVTVEGVCSEIIPATGDCRNSRMNVIVDASSGEPIVAVAAEAQLVGEPLG